MHDLCRSYRLKRQGVSTAEFAVAAPLFILLVFGMIEYGRMLTTQQVLMDASSAGAQQYTGRVGTEQEVRAAVVDYLRHAGFRANVDAVVVSMEAAEGEDESGVKVTTSIPCTEVTWIPTSVFLGSDTLVATTTTEMSKQSIDTSTN